MENEIVLSSKNKDKDKDKDNEKELLMIFLMKDFIKNHSLEPMSNEIFSTLLNNDLVKSKNLEFMEQEKNLDKMKNLILQNVPSNDIFSNSRFVKEYNIIDKIGMGGFGSVFKTQNKLDKKKYAIKIVNMNYENSSVVLREVENLSQLDHPNIIRYYGSWLENIEFNSDNKYLSYDNDESEYTETESSEIETTNYLFLKMELADNCLKNIQNNLNFKQKRDIFHQIVLGLDEIHSKNIIHRDLKPSNILILDNKVKIGDFGLSKYIEGLHGRKEIKGINSDLTGMMGSALYSSPEQLNGEMYNFKTDIYSLGIILFDMLNNFDTEMERSIKIENLKNGNFDRKFLDKYKKESLFIKILIDKDYNKRPNTDLILNMLSKFEYF